MHLPKLLQRKVTTVDLFFNAKIGALWSVYKKAPDKFNWESCDYLLKIIVSMSIRCGLLWFEVNTVLIPMPLEDLKH